MSCFAITGAFGFIGRHLLAEVNRRGDLAICLARSGFIGSGAPHVVLPWSLDQIPRLEDRDIDFAVHLAHDFNGEEGAQRTIDGTLRAINAFSAAGVRRQIFFSSISAGAHATSLYGRTKFSIEERLAGMPDICIVRPGLVLGDGGIYGRIQKWLRLFPIVPLPDGGYGAMPAVRVEDLCREVYEIFAEEKTPTERNIYEAQLKTLRDLIIEEARRSSLKVLILPFPSKPLLLILEALGKLRIPLPVTADNLNGFLANQTVAEQLKDRNHQNAS